MSQLILVTETNAASPQHIKLQTAKRWDIPNSVEPDPSPGLVQLACSTPQMKMLLGNARGLRPASGRYNCHGLVFASRRTNIPAAGLDDHAVVSVILQDDGYKKMEKPQVGDVAVYRNELGNIEHTGIVCEVDPHGIVPTVWIWSMWGALGEFRHKSGVTPYNGEPEYWRLNI